MEDFIKRYEQQARRLIGLATALQRDTPSMRMTPVLNRLMRSAWWGHRCRSYRHAAAGPVESLSPAIPRLCRPNSTNRRFAGVLFSGSMFGTAFRRCWETAYSLSTVLHSRLC